MVGLDGQIYGIPAAATVRTPGDSGVHLKGVRAMDLSKTDVNDTMNLHDPQKIIVSIFKMMISGGFRSTPIYEHNIPIGLSLMYERIIAPWDVHQESDPKMAVRLSI